jgi:hypothetical protein
VTKVDFKVASNNLNVDEILAPSAAGEGKPAETGPVTTGDEPLSLPVLPDVVVKGTVAAAKITVKKIDVTRLNTRIDVTKAAISMATNAALYTGSITQTLSVKLPSAQAVSFENVFNAEHIEANDFTSRFKTLLPSGPGASPIFARLGGLDGVLSGKMTLKSRFSGNGGTVNQIKKNLVGEILLDIFDGRIAPNRTVQAVFSATSKVGEIMKMAGRPSPFEGSGEIAFRKLHNKITVKDETVTLDDFTFDSKEGDWLVRGTVGFNAVMNMNLSDKLTPPLSGQLLSGQKKASGAAQKGVSAVAGKLGAAGGLVQSAADAGMEAVSIPADKQGRVTMNIGLAGPVDSPQPRWNGFGAPGDKEGPKAQAAKSSPKQQAKQQAQQQVQRKTQEVKAQAAQQVQKAAEPVKQEVNKAADKAKEALKKKKLPF